MRKARETENNKKRKTNKIKTRKIKFSKKTKIIIISILIIIIGIILISNYTSLGLVLNKNISTKDAIQIELASSNNNMYAYQDGVLVYNNGKLSCYNKHGKLNWSRDIEDTINANINVAGEYIQLINKDKNIIYIFKNKYEVARIKSKENILYGNINKEGMSIIEYKPSGSKKAISIYDKRGNEKYSIKLNNDIIGKYVMSDDSRYLAYIDVDISGISALTKVNLIDLEKKDSNYITVYSKENSLVYNVYFYGKNIVIRTDEEFAVYNISNSKTNVKEITENSYENVGTYNMKYAYIKLNDKAEYYLTIANILSEKEKNILIDESPKYFFYENGLAYLCYSKKIQIYNNFGMKIKEYNSDTIITKPVVFNDGKSLALMISNKIVMFTI